MKWVVLSMITLGACASADHRERGPGLHDYRGIIHCHSHFSHDSSGTYKEILAAAKAADVDFVILTDHPPKGDRGKPLREGWRGLHERVLFVQGAEYAGDNLLGLGIREPAAGKGPAAKIASIHAQGGIAIVSHPEQVQDWSPYADADGMEIYNVHAALKLRAKEKGFLFRAIKEVKKNPDEAFMMLQQLDPAILEKWDELNLKRRWVGIAGNDAHQNFNIGTLQLDPYERVFKFVSTHVLAEGLDEESILVALRKGLCYVAFDLLGDFRGPLPDDAIRKTVRGGRIELWRSYGSELVPWMIANPGIEPQAPLTPRGR